MNTPQSVPVSAIKASLVAGAIPTEETGQVEAFTPKETGQEAAYTFARDQLRAYIERIERLEEEKKTVADDIKDVYTEAKGTGFDTKVLKKVIAIRKQDKDERMEQEAILDTYLLSLGMLEA
jgi:uncharacterized protein (UPF0335 family)